MEVMWNVEGIDSILERTKTSIYMWYYLTNAVQKFADTDIPVGIATSLTSIG